MNKVQQFLQKLIGVPQTEKQFKATARATPKTTLIPFSPRAAFGLPEPPALDLNAQIQAYNSWVYACVKKRSQEIANIKLRLYQRKNEDEVVEMKKHDVLDLLDRVNEFMTRYDLFELTSIYWDLTGEAFWWKLRDSNSKVVSIYPYLSPVNMQVVPNPETFISGYIYSIPGTGKQIPFEAKDIIHFKYPNPINPYRGISPVKAAEFAIASDREALKWNWRFFKNQAKPGGVIKVPGTLSQDQYDRIKAQWESMHGGAENAHKVAIIEAGGEFTETGISQKDMDFLKQREFGRDEIFAVFGVPKGVITADDVNRATAETHKAIFVEETIVPILRKITCYLNEFLLPDYSDDTLFFDFDDPSPRNVEGDLAYYANAIMNGWMSPNEVRREEGFEDFEGGDAVFLPMAMIEVGRVTKAGRKVFNIRRLKRTGQEVLTDKINEKIKENFKEISISLGIQNKKNSKPEIKKAKRELKFTEEMKEMIWNKMILKLNREELIMKKKLIIQFGRQEKEVLGSVAEKEYKKISFSFDESNETGVFIDVFKPLIVEFIKNHGEDAFDLLGLEGFNVNSADIVSFLKKDGLKFAKEVNAVTKDKILKAISDGTEAGEGIIQIKDRVKEVFTEAKDSRAFAIARTESSRASNFGITEGYRQSKVVKGKEWVTAFDERTCDYCLAMNGKIVNLENNFFDEGDDFKPRGTDKPMDLDYADVGEPPLHANCRCTTIPVLID